MKKKLFATILTLAISLSLFPMNKANAATTEDGKWDGTISGSTVTDLHPVDASSLEGAVIIPKIVTIAGTNYNVVSLGANAFAGCGKITYLGIPSTITVDIGTIGLPTDVIVSVSDTHPSRSAIISAGYTVENEVVVTSLESNCLVTYSEAGNGEINGTGYVLSLPKTIVLKKNEEDKAAKLEKFRVEGDYTVRVKGTGDENTISGDSYVVVTPRDTISTTDGVNIYLTDVSGARDSVVATITQETTKFDDVALINTDEGMVRHGAIQATSVTAGADWQGQLIFDTKLITPVE